MNNYTITIFCFMKISPDFGRNSKCERHTGSSPWCCSQCWNSICYKRKISSRCLSLCHWTSVVSQFEFNETIQAFKDNDSDRQGEDQIFSKTYIYNEKHNLEIYRMKLFIGIFKHITWYKQILWANIFCSPPKAKHWVRNLNANRSNL